MYSCGESVAPTEPTPRTDELDDPHGNIDPNPQPDSASIWKGLYDSIPPLSDAEFRAKYNLELDMDGREYFSLDWDILGQVSFEERFNKEEQAYFDYPTYSADVLAFHNRDVVISGHLIPFEPETGGYFLSANPNASCFFCGEAGPETVIALTIDDVTDEMVMDAVLTFRGKLLLNREDVFQMNYRIPNAVLVEK